MEQSAGRRTMLQKVVYLVFKSVLDWAMSMAILLSLFKFGDVKIFYAKRLWDLFAVTFVYLVSVRSVFYRNNKYLKTKFATRIVYSRLPINFISIFTSAFLIIFPSIQRVIFLPLGAPSGKGILSPFALLINNIFAQFLLERIDSTTEKELFSAR